ncbi:hypothetical protein [Nonomuraea sp. NPDC005692]|uniref:hypothetical protein n=1 Tax=Nonomuraea sp. NPDC005692 TaxID=3157168 RepID=UPI00340E92A9
MRWRPTARAWCRPGPLVPDGFDDHLTKAEHVLDDTRFVALNKDCWAAEDQASAMARLTTLVEAKLRSAGVDIPHQ